MKKLELNQMENLEGGKGGFITGLTCATYLLAGGAFAIGTAGIGAAVAVTIGALGCGVSVGHGLDTGSWW